LPVKIYVSGLNLKVSDLHLIDGNNQALQLSWKKVYFRGFKFWAREIRLQYLGYSLNTLQILRLSIRELLSCLARNRKMALSEIFFSFEGTILFDGAVRYPIKASHSQSKFPLWISRYAIISGVSSFVYGPEIEWDRARFPNKFAGFVWGIEDGEHYLPRGFKKEQVYEVSKLSLIKDLNFDNSAIDTIENYKTINDCVVFNGLFALKDGTLHYLDRNNQLEEISWPTNFVSNLNGELNIIDGLPMFSENIQEAVLYGSSPSWYHFLVETLPSLIRIRASGNSEKVLLVRGELPDNIINILTHLEFKEVIFMKDGTKLSVTKLEMLTDLRLPSAIDIASRKYDLINVRNFLLSLAITPSKSPFIYIERDPALFRPLYKSAQLKKRLLELGFLVVRPESVDLVKQIELFKNAEVVVAQGGAALTNILFMPRGSHVVEITGEGNTLCFYEMCKVFNIKHTMIQGKTRFLPSIFIKNGAFKIPLEKTISIIEEIMRESSQKTAPMPRII
jgi:hypothetical protein